MITPFSVDNLAVFERHGATVERKRPDRAGCWVYLPNGWTLSIQWDSGNYCSNRDFDRGRDHARQVPDATSAEIAAWRDDNGDMVRWVEGDTVLGWCSMERVQHILDLLAEDTLMREEPQPPVMVADDHWTDVPA